MNIPDPSYGFIPEQIVKAFRHVMAYLRKHTHDGGGGGAVVDHGTTTGRDDDDHTLYLTAARHTALDGEHVTNGDTHDHVGGDGGQIHHGGLSGLLDDDHSNYAYLPGRPNGQTFFGDINTGGNLYLESTAHATKGRVISNNPFRIKRASGDTWYYDTIPTFLGGGYWNFLEAQSGLPSYNLGYFVDGATTSSPKPVNFYLFMTDYGADNVNYQYGGLEAAADGTLTIKTGKSGSGAAGNIILSPTGVGIITVYPTYVYINRAQNAATYLKVNNSQAEGIYRRAEVITDCNPGSAFMGGFPIDFSDSHRAGKAVFGANSTSACLLLEAAYSGQYIQFIAGTTTEVARITASGLQFFADTVTPLTEHIIKWSRAAQEGINPYTINLWSDPRYDANVTAVASGITMFRVISADDTAILEIAAAYTTRGFIMVTEYNVADPDSGRLHFGKLSTTNFHGFSFVADDVDDIYFYFGREVARLGYASLTLHQDLKVMFGSDVELYREAANVLYTPDTFKAGALQLEAGTATKAPITLAAGVVRTTPENHAVEYDGARLYLTVGDVRKTLAFTSDISDLTAYALLAGRAGGQTLIGGTAITDVLKLQGTSGDGTLTSPAIQFLVGNNGGTVAMTVLNNGTIGIGTATPITTLEVGGGVTPDGAILAIGTYGSGWTAPNLGAGTRMLWYPRKAAFRAGDTDGTEMNDVNIGVRSAGFGFRPKAKGSYSFVAGYEASATENGAVAMGMNVTASGNCSVAMGSVSSASGGYAFTMGMNVAASGSYSVAMGNYVTASGVRSFAAGAYLTAGSAANTFVLGQGVSNASRLINNIAGSLMVGFNSTVPTLFVGPSTGVGTTGAVGIGTVLFDASAASTLALGNGTAPAAHTDNQIYVYSIDSSDATSTLALFLEQAVEDIGTFTASHKVKILLNNVEYWIQLDAVA